MNAIEKFHKEYEEYMRHSPQPPTLAVKAKMYRSNEEPFRGLVTFFVTVEDHNIHLEIVRLDGNLFKIPQSCYIQMSLSEDDLRDVLMDQEVSFDLDSPEEHTVKFSAKIITTVKNWLNNLVADIY